MPAHIREKRAVISAGASACSDRGEAEAARGGRSAAVRHTGYSGSWRVREVRYRRVMAIAVLACGAVVVTNLMSLGFDHLRTSAINANWEFSWSHDVDTVLLAVGVYASLGGARATGPHRRVWATTAAILALFVLDEVSAVHGQLGNLEKLLYAPILAALVVCVWRLTAGTSERALVRWALATLVFAFAMHVVGLHLLRPIGYTKYIYQAGVGIKEGTELAGLILLITALWRRSASARAASVL
jgi:hypothetical protein